MRGTVTGVILLPVGRTEAVGAILLPVGKTAVLGSGAIPLADGKTTTVGAILLPVGKTAAVGVILAAANKVLNRRKAHRVLTSFGGFFVFYILHYRSSVEIMFFSW